MQTLKMFCLKCNSEIYMLMSPACAVCSSKIHFNLNIPSTSSMNSLDLQSGESVQSMENYEKCIEKTIKDLDEVGEEMKTYRTLNSEKIYLTLRDVLFQTGSEKNTRLVVKIMPILSTQYSKYFFFQF